MFLGGAHARMGALEDAWHVYKARVGAPDPAAAAALAGAGFTTVASPALRPAQRAALVREPISHHLLLPSSCWPRGTFTEGIADCAGQCRMAFGQAIMACASQKFLHLKIDL